MNVENKVLGGGNLVVLPAAAALSRDLSRCLVIG